MSWVPERVTKPLVLDALPLGGGGVGVSVGTSAPPNLNTCPLTPTLRFSATGQAPPATRCPAALKAQAGARRVDGRDGAVPILEVDGMKLPPLLVAMNKGLSTSAMRFD